MSIGASAVTQACCEVLLQSSTEQWRLHFALISAAVHLFWITALLYEEQMSIGVSAVTQPAVRFFCRAALNSGDCILP